MSLSLAKSFPAILFLALTLCIGAARGIKCYKCGEYNEGVGSITPCINYTAHMHLKECPPSAEWCIKYVSEGSTVRDCVPTCTEKEAWSTRRYCCQEDGCNGSGTSTGEPGLVLLSLAVTAAAAAVAAAAAFPRG